MTALAGNLDLFAACFFTGGAAVFAFRSAGARHVRAFLVICFFHYVPHSGANIDATH
jgi:hypothetical protein